MQHLHNQPSRKQGLPVAGILWLGLAATGAWFLAFPARTPAMGLLLAIGLLTLFVAAIVATFSLRYMRADARPERYFFTLGALVAAVLGFVFTGDLLVLGVAWCASGWLLADLIGHSEDCPEAKAAARRTRATFLLGDAALLAALALLGWSGGSWQVDAALAHAPLLPPAIATVIALLLVVSAAARCALPPFSGWLLSSMTAPTPVSALMHAGLVNAGGFLLIRFAPVLEAAPLARAVAVVLGLCGAIYGIGIMMVRPDVKRSLAGSTVSQMGFLVMSCGLGAYAAALWHLVAHGLFKAWLFLGSGSTIGMRVGTRTPLQSRRATLAIATTTFAVALAIVLSGDGNASLVPLLLGLATALATLLATFAGKVPLRTKATLLALVAALVAFHSGGLALVTMAIGKDAAPLAPNWALLALLAVFLGGWAWQQQRVSAGGGLPLRLYVHLINAGALRATGKGEAK